MNIVLIGGGTQVSYTIDIIEKENKHKIIGIIDSIKDIGHKIENYKVIGKQEDMIRIVNEYSIEGCVISIGDNWTRKAIYEQICGYSIKLNWPNVIHPSVIIGNNVKIGQGMIAMAGVIINSNSKLGDFVNLYTNCNIEHDCIINDYASISAGVVLGGLVEIGKFSAISLNATVFDRLCIGENTVVGAASLITKNLPDDVLAYGVPAKIIRKREKKEKFLK